MILLIYDTECVYSVVPFMPLALCILEESYTNTSLAKEEIDDKCIYSTILTYFSLCGDLLKIMFIESN